MALQTYDANIPLYIQIREALLKDIRSHYEAGDYLPSEHELSGEYGVNRHTLRRAIDELIKDGIVERFHGRGTVVLDIPINYPVQKNNRFTETLKTLGHLPVSKILKKELIQAKGGIARRLELIEGQQVLWMETIRYVNERPIGVSAQFLPQPYGGAVFEAYKGGSLHQFLYEQFDLKLKRAFCLITAVLPQDEDARQLQMSRRQPLLRMKTVNVNETDGTPVEYAVARARADLVQIQIDMD